MVQLRGSLVTQWNDLYPGVPFPNPEGNPQMFPSDFVIKKTVYTYDYSWWDDLWGDCCAFSRCCAKGMIDYECQYNNSCYLNLMNLGIHVLGFLLGLILLIILFVLACRLTYKFIISVAFITKFIKCLGGCLKCFTLGIFDQKVYYKNQEPKAQFTDEENKILSKTKQLGIKIVMPRLDSEQKKRILEIFEDYQIQESNSICCVRQDQKNQDQHKKQKKQAPQNKTKMELHIKKNQIKNLTIN